MPPETSDIHATRPASAARDLQYLRHRLALLIVTFSVVVLPNMYSFVAELLQGV